MQVGDGGSLRVLTALAMATALAVFVCPLTVSFPLLDPDEGLHAAIAQEMAVNGDWVTPQFIGRPFWDKPPLYFWAQAASLRLFGSSETAVRLPGLFFGFLGAVSTGLLGCRMFSPTLGLVAFALYATMIYPAAMTQAAPHDVALIPCVNLSLLLLWESGRTTNRATVIACILGAGLFLGLAILTKGLMGVAVIGVAFGGYLLFGLVWRKNQPTGSNPWAWEKVKLYLLKPSVCCTVTIVVAVVVATPWYLAMESRNPGYLRYFFLERHFLGFITGSQPHGARPWWYYLPILLGGGLPWIGYLSVVVRQQQPDTGRSMSMLWCWLIGWTLLLSVAGSKMATYLWPAFPAVALLAAIAWTAAVTGEMKDTAWLAFKRTFVWATLAGPATLPVVAAVVVAVFGVRFGWTAWSAVAIGALAALLPLIPWVAGRRLASLAAATISVMLQLAVAMVFLLPPVAGEYTARDLAWHFNRQGQLPTRLMVVEERIGSLVFYLSPALRRELTPEQVQSWTVNQPLPVRSGDVLAVPERRLLEVLDILELDGKPFDRAGRYRLYQYTDDG